MRLTKIYTKVGDKGTTLLANGQSVAKDSKRIEAYGAIDELNSHVGLLRDLLAQFSNDIEINILRGSLQKIQNELFDIGGELATPPSAINLDRQQVVTARSISRLEEEMDKANELLVPLSNFILPGGSVIVSQSHVARTICRRAERRIVTLSEVEGVRSEVKIYVNRLSDWLFVMGRLLGKNLGVDEILWQQEGKN